MNLTRELADVLLRDHPERAAAVLERTEPSASVAMLSRGDPADAAQLLRRLSPQRSSRALAALPPARAAELLDRLALDEAVRLVRRLAVATRDELIAHVEPRRARAMSALLGFAPGTAGALMDPEVLALPRTLSARDALARVRAEPESARYNLYVLDDEQRLVGALNLRELFLARPESTLADLMVASPQHLRADADRASLIGHPGWKEVHSLPVVDERGAYLGAVRYRTLRELEQELLSGPGDEQRTAAALGQLFAAGAAGLFEALGGAGAAPEEPSRGR